MPISIKSEQARFKWQLADEKPVAPVIRIGNGLWCQCPLCGCLHDTFSRKDGAYTPRCLPREWNTANYKAWIAKFPDAASHTTVQLVLRSPMEIMPYIPPAIETKPKPRRTRKKAA